MTLCLPGISSSDRLLNTPLEFPEGAMLKLRLRLSRSSYWIEAHAQVRYCFRHAGNGIEFRQIAREAVRAIEKEIANGL